MCARLVGPDAEGDGHGSGFKRRRHFSEVREAWAVRSAASDSILCVRSVPDVLLLCADDVEVVMEPRDT